MNFNNQTYTHFNQTVNDPNAIRDYLDSLSGVIIDYHVVPYQVQENVIKYFIYGHVDLS